jgi:hypothetical protein
MIRHRFTLAAALAIALTLGGCQTVPEAGAGRCNAARVQNFVGALGTTALGRIAVSRTKARSVRWLAPGSAATMDYRMDRLNIRVDERNFITSLDCG